MDPLDPYNQRTYRLCLDPVLGGRKDTKPRGKSKKKRMQHRRPSSAAVRVYRCELPQAPIIKAHEPKREKRNINRRRHRRKQRRRPRTAGAERAIVPTPAFDPDAIRIAPGDESVQSSRATLLRLLRKQKQDRVHFDSNAVLRSKSRKTQKLIDLEAREHKIALCIKMTKGDGTVQSAAERISAPGKAGRLLDQWVHAEKDLCKELRRNARLNGHNHTKSRNMMKRMQKKRITDTLSVIKSKRQRQRELALARLKEFQATIEKATKVRLLSGMKSRSSTSVNGADVEDGRRRRKNDTMKKKQTLSELSRIRRESVRVYGRVRRETGR